MVFDLDDMELQNFFMGGPGVTTEHGGLPDALRAKIWLYLMDCSDTDNIDAILSNLTLDLLQQTTIKRDVARVNHLAAVKANKMEAMLTYFCKTHNVEYLEGLSDVLLPVLSLPISISQTFQCFTALVKKFIPKMAFRPVSTSIGGVGGLLQSNPKPLNPLLKMFHLLVMYHDPKLGRFLEQNRVYPEMYAAGWLNLLMSRSCEPEALLRLWDAYIVQQKPSLNVFVALAVLIRARDSILNSSREATLQQLGSICISTAKEAAQLLEKAGAYMHATPVSVQHLLASSSFNNDDEDEEEGEEEKTR
eukprot:GILJ01023699.1.p1 GENE.GILJ01023699.1~~GILJ01023699.1.p1  ORF type:complete len:331 (-),score=72.34 GILJ01023699.1:2-916(-)